MNIATLLLALLMAAPHVVADSVRDGAKHHKLQKKMTVSQVLEKYTDRWMAIKGVLGTGEGKTKDGKPCIMILVDRKTPKLEKSLPKRVEGYSVTIEETGTVKALPKQ